MEGVSGSGQKVCECDAEPVETLAQQKAKLSREARQFLNQFDIEGSQKKRLKKEKRRKVLTECWNGQKKCFKCLKKSD
jgi:hypothetical protein